MVERCDNPLFRILLSVSLQDIVNNLGVDSLGIALGLRSSSDSGKEGSELFICLRSYSGIEDDDMSKEFENLPTFQLIQLLAL